MEELRVTDQQKYSAIIEGIKCIIAALADVAGDDPVARDSLANLSAVALELQTAQEGTQLC